jgi:iron complex outermembrane receptor protein
MQESDMGRHFGALAAAGAVVLSAPGQVRAAAPDEAPRLLDIPAGPLGSALETFSVQSGQQLLYAPSAADGKRSRAIHGRLTPPQALSRMLGGTALLWRPSPGGAFLLMAMEAPPRRGLLAEAEAASPPASLASARDSGDGAGGDIIVTATRRAERLQDVPIAVTALSVEKLDEQQITDVTSLAKVVPGMQVKPNLNPLQITVAIRGVTQLTVSPAVDPPIGIYVDGIYNVINAGSNNALIDMERVEVLKGPQGTLFGRNTIGGAISITTAKPTNRFEGYVQLDGGNYGAFTGTGVINVPVAPGFVDARLVYQHTQHDGYGRNFTTGSPTSTFHQHYVRGSVKIAPGGSWEALLSGFYDKAHGYSAPYKLGYINSSFNASYPMLSGNMSGDLLSNYVNRGGWQDTYADLDTIFAMRQYGVTGTISGELGSGVSVKSITGYTHTSYDQTGDLDGTPYPFLHIISFPVRANQISQELQILGDGLDNRLKWIAGVYYFSVDASQISNNTTLLNLAPAGSRTYTTNGPYANNRSYSAFGQISYEIAPHVKLTGGVRYVVDKRRATYRDHREVPGPTPGAFVSCSLANAADPVTGARGTDEAACLFTDSVRYHYAPWTVGIDYDPNRTTLIYAKASRGYRSGAFANNGPTAVAPSSTVTAAQAVQNNAAALRLFGPVSPESILTFELGTKLQLLDRRLRLSVAAYRSNYKNIQQSVNVIPCNGCANANVLENSGNARIWGGELEAVALLGRLEIDGSVGITRPRYRRGSPSYGQPVVNVSKFNGSIGASYPIDMQSGKLVLTTTYAYRSTATFYTSATPLPPAAQDAISQKGFGLLSARASLALSGMPLTLAVFGQNLTDRKYRSAATNLPAPLGYAAYSPGAPRTFGGSIRYSF